MEVDAQDNIPMMIRCRDLEFIKDLHDDRCEFTIKTIEKKINWDKGFMPMRNFIMEFLSDDSLGVVMYANPLKIYIGIIGLTKFSDDFSIEFANVEEMVRAGWLVD